MIRLLGLLFSLASLSLVAAIGGIALVVWLYDRDLPTYESLLAYEPKTLSRVYSGEGALIAEFARERRIFVPSAEIPELVKNAFVSAEDKNFWRHPGVDAVGILRAMVANARALREGGGQIQGASTITQQVMKNFLLSSDRSIERKIKEAILSIRFERAFSKERILELYLNEIFLGQNAYGVAAAAQRYFGKTLEDLTLAEAAYLAALPKAPSDLHPVRQRARSIERRNYVLREMRENGYISETDMLVAQTEPLRTLLDGSLEPTVATPGRPDHFTEEVRRQLTQRLGDAALFEGGLTVRATIDPELQEIAGDLLREALLRADGTPGWRGPLARIEPLDPADEAAWRAALARVEAARDVPGWRLAVVLDVSADGARIGVEGRPAAATDRILVEDVRRWARRRLPEGGLGPAPRSAADVWAVGDVVHVSEVTGESGEILRWRMRQTPDLQGAFMAMDVHTGRVLALHGGFSHETSVFNRATQALRQPGSAFKPFVYAAALDVGYTPASIILDAPVAIEAGGVIWRPQNASGKFYGPSTMRIGLEMSRNLMTVRLAQEIGMDRVADYAERFGLYETMEPHLAFALGAGETTLYQMVAAYAMFANGGRVVEPTLVDRVQDRRGATIYRHDPRVCLGCDGAAGPDGPPPRPVAVSEQVIDPITAYQITSMLEGAVRRGTGKRAFADVSVPVAGKTGTTNEARDVWFVGYTPTMAFGCFMGYDDPKPMGDEAFGGTLCAPLVAEFVRRAYASGARRPGAFEVPPGVEFVTIDRWSGRRTDAPLGGDVIAEVIRAGQPLEGLTALAGGESRVIGEKTVYLASGGSFPLGVGEAVDALPASGAAAVGGGERRTARPAAPAITRELGAPGGLY